jgi:hypothetical protein
VSTGFWLELHIIASKCGCSEYNGLGYTTLDIIVALDDELVKDVVICVVTLYCVQRRGLSQHSMKSSSGEQTYGVL